MKTKKSFLWLAFLILATIWILVRHNQQVGYYSVKGLVFGTVYKITYQHDGDLKPEIEAELKRFDQSLSPFNDSSVISRVNRNEELVTDSFFQKCFHRSMEISRETKGAFDITVAPLANAWGFGFKKGAFPNSLMIDSLLQITGYEKVKMDNGKVIKQDPRTMLSCSAVAKGYSVDVIAQLLDRKGIKNYMVDIGGEVVVKGKNPSKGLWRIGINKPIDDSLAVNQDLQTILEITDLGLATSVGDEGGFAPALKSDEEAIETILEAVKKAGYEPGKDFKIAMDAASSEWKTGKVGEYKLPKAGTVFTSEELIAHWKKLVEKYPIISIEDALDEEDWEGWKKLTAELGDKVQLVGDDLFVTNTERLAKGISLGCGNSILIKLNQIGSVSETLEAIKMAHKAGYTAISSHRSGETEDTTIADLAVALNTCQIKTGAPSRTERVAKYNQLLRIEEELGAAAVYPGMGAFNVQN